MRVNLAMRFLNLGGFAGGDCGNKAKGPMSRERDIFSFPAFKVIAASAYPPISPGEKFAFISFSLPFR